MPDHHGYLLPNERRILLRQYAPILVLFPELEEQAPYPDDGDAIYTLRGSYHPRAMDLFLARAQVRYKRSVTMREPNLLRAPRDWQAEVQAVEQTITDEEVERAFQAYNCDCDPRYAGLDDTARRAKRRQQLLQQRLGERLSGFDQPVKHSQNITQWKMYFGLLREVEPTARRSVVYGRLSQGRQPLDADLSATESLLEQGVSYGPYDVSRTRVALQYWFHFYYDDWANRHEGDLESITLLVELSRHAIEQSRELTAEDLLAGIEVQDAGYAAHEDGFRRLWDDTQRAKDGRPIVYIARGSSASYFAWQLEGYPASARVGVVEDLLNIPGRLLRGRRFLGRRWDAQYAARFTGRDPKNTDWVAADPEADDRLGDEIANPLERRVPRACRGVRRSPDFGPNAGLDDRTYHLETDDLFWLEMAQEYGARWGEDSPWPGSKGPGGVSRAERDAKRADIHRLANLEVIIERALESLSSIRFFTTEAIPELNPALRRLRPQNLRQEGCFPQRIHPYVYSMWARLLADHPEAWPDGQGLRLRIIFRRILYPGVLGFLFKRPQPEPLLKRSDPLYLLKSLLAQTRRIRYEIQHEGSKWDNPFAWVRYICRADDLYYGRAREELMTREELLGNLDCIDTDMSEE